MKNITKTIILFLVATVFYSVAETVTINSTRYKLRVYNHQEDAGIQYSPSDKTTIPVGMYDRPSGYDAEILCNFDLSPIPEGATINSVSLSYSVNSISGGTHPVVFFKNTRSWTGTPQYNALGNTPWPSSDLLVSETCDATGVRNFPSNANLISMVNEWISNTSDNHGIIVTNTPNYFAYNIDVSKVSLVIDYNVQTISHTIDLTIGSNGSVEVSAIGFPATTYSTNVSLDFDVGVEVTLRSIPGSAFYDVLWSGDITGNDETVTITLESDKMIAATFTMNLLKRDSLALVDLFTKTNGVNWTDNTNWLTLQPIDSWFGITITDNRVSAINLANNNMRDSIVTSIWTLNNLQSLRLNNNQLTSIIPMELGRLSNLQHLSLNDNQLTGSVPQEIGNLVNLTVLNISNNQLTGDIPSSYSALTNLSELIITGNNFLNLPNEITVLNPNDSCNLGGNQFCLLSPSVITWANTLDPDWASTQNCATPTFQITANPLTGSAPLNVTFTATNTGNSNIDSWLWDFDDGDSSTEQNPVHNFATSGIFTVEVTATGIGGNAINSTTITVVVSPLITVSATPLSGALPLDVTFTAVNNGGATNTWLWNFGDGSTATIQNPTHTYSTGGTFTVIATATGVGGTSIDSVVIEVTAPPIITLNASPITGEVPLPVTYSATSTGGAVSSWLWDYGDGTTGTVQNPPVHTYSNTGTYTATVTATNIAGTVTESQIITVVEATTTLTINAAGGGTSTPSGSIQVIQGVATSITATPAPGNIFVNWTVQSGSAIIANSSQSSTTVQTTDNSTIIANFALIEFTLTISSEANGTTDPSGDVTAQYGINVPVEAIADSGYIFAIWNVSSGTALIENATLASTNIICNDGDAEITASFSSTATKPLNQMLTITGTLTDTLGNPVGYPNSEDIDISVRLTTDAIAGDTLYTEFFHKTAGNGITVDNGVFIVRLGSGVSIQNLQSIISSHNNLYVEFTIENGVPDVLLPRTPLTAAPYTIASPTESTLHFNTIYGAGNPNDNGSEGNIGLYFIDNESGSTWIRLNTGWKMLD